MIKYSEMSGKLKHIPALNTSPLNNPFCQKMYKSKKSNICNSCYSIDFLNRFRQNCIPRFTKNGEYLSEDIHPPKYLPDPPNALYVRFSAHGELINLNHAINLFQICNKNPKTTFTLWTKRYDLVWRAIDYMGKPKNLILIYSAIRLDQDKKLPMHFDKVFIVQAKKNDKTNCFGKCIDCLKCYTKTDTTTHIYEEIK
tara:strand:+ start:195 stop:788 length:594 start_codon:yes stop_codon:yes gene_type:complete